MEGKIGVIRPEALLDILSGDDFARSFQEKLKDFEWLPLQPDANAVLSQLSPPDVQLEGLRTDGSVAVAPYRPWDVVAQIIILPYVPSKSVA